MSCWVSTTSFSLLLRLMLLVGSRFLLIFSSPISTILFLKFPLGFTFTRDCLRKFVSLVIFGASRNGVLFSSSGDFSFSLILVEGWDTSARSFLEDICFGSTDSSLSSSLSIDPSRYLSLCFWNSWISLLSMQSNVSSMLVFTPSLMIESRSAFTLWYPTSLSTPV